MVTVEKKNMKHLDKVFKERGKYIQIWVGKERTIDPASYDKDITYYTPITISVLDVNQLSPEQLQWKMSGQYTTDAKVLVIDRDYLSAIKLSHKLTIDNKEYYGYRDASGNNFQIREIDNDYFQIYTVRK